MPTGRIPKELEERILSMADKIDGKPVIREPQVPEVDEAAEEEAFRCAFESYAKGLGWATYHTYNSRKSNKGWPDEVAVRGKVIFYAELKSATGRLTADQERWIELLREAGQTVYVWRPSDWAEIKRVLA